MYKERIKNFSTLFLGNIFGQFVALALYPYIARFYLPEEFSRFGFIVSLTTVISMFATGQLHTAVMNPKEDAEAEKLVGSSTILVLITALFAIIVFLFLDRSLLVVPLYILLYSMNEIAKMVFVRRQAFTTSANSQVTFRVVGNGLKLVPSLVKLGSTGLVFSEIISLFLVVIYAIKKKVLNLKFDKDIFAKYWKFLAVQTFTVALALLIGDFPILFWSSKYSAEYVGHFVMAQKLLITPALVFSGALQNSSVHHFLKAKDQLPFYLKLIIGTSIAGAIAFVLIKFFGESIFTLLLGARWSGGIEVYELLALSFITKFGLLVTQAIFVLKHEVRTSFILRGIQLVILFILLQNDFSFFQALKIYVYLDLVLEIILAICASFLILKTQKGN